MNRRVRGVIGAALLGAAGLSGAGQIDVMTQNQYLGADLAPVLAAATADPFDPQVFSGAVVAALTTIAGNRPAERARALAAMIVQRNPDVVGLQEVYEFRCDPYPGFPTAPGLGCDDPDIRAAFTDHAADMQAALRGRYSLVGRVTNMKVEGMPFVVNGFPAVLSLADRDAILVRSGLEATPVNFGALPACRASDQGCNYWTAPPVFDTPIGPLAIERGFVAADVTVKGAAYRIFNTHLEQRLLAPTLPETRLLQVGQAYELLGMALATTNETTRLIVLGDFNSDPSDVIPTPPYPPTLPGTPGWPTLTPWQVFALNGFTDAWLMRPQGGPGYSCCEAEKLDNRQSALYERIDLVLSRTPPARVTDMRVLGTTMGQKTRPPGRAGLWASDHAGVAARLQFD